MEFNFIDMKRFAFYLIVVIMSSEVIANTESKTPPVLDQLQPISSPDTEQSNTDAPTVHNLGLTVANDLKSSDVDSEHHDAVSASAMFLDNPESKQKDLNVPVLISNTASSVNSKTQVISGFDQYQKKQLQASKRMDSGRIIFPDDSRPIDPFRDDVQETTQSNPTTQSDKEKECIRKCPVTPEFNPICGTNFVTYNNPSYIHCAQTCGVNVTVMRTGRCSMTTTSTSSTTTSSTTPSTITPQPSKVKECIRNCPVTSEYNPVCGTDYVTYDNVGRLICAKTCGVDVSVMKKARCTASTTSATTSGSTTTRFTTTSTTTRPTTTIRTTTPSTTTTTTQTSKITECMSGCPKAKERNPVCGTDYVTYPNPAQLNCAYMCGVDVKVMKRGNCPERPAS